MSTMSPELAHQLTAIDPAVLGARIRAARVAAGLTQPELAGADASVAYVSRIESGQRRPGTELLRSLATKLGVTLDYLILGEGWEDAQRLEVMLDHAELALVGGEGAGALARVHEVLLSPGLDAIPGGHDRARYLEAAALDTLGDVGAARAFQLILQSQPDYATRLKAATALSRIWREQGQLDRAIACAQEQLNVLPPDALGTEEGVRLSVTLAAALSMAGRVAEAVELCDDAIAEAERLSSPVARASAYWNASLFRSECGEMSEALTLAKRALHLLENTERVRDLGTAADAVGHDHAEVRSAAPGGCKASSCGLPTSSWTGARPPPPTARGTTSSRPRRCTSRVTVDEARDCSLRRRGSVRRPSCPSSASMH